MTTLQSAKMPSLKDKINDEEKAVKAELEAVSEELVAVKKAKKRAGKN